jgi:hypothetical protein
MAETTGYESARAIELHRALASVLLESSLAESAQQDALYAEIDGLNVNTYYTNLMHGPVKDVPVNNNPPIHRMLLRQGLGIVSVNDSEAQGVVVLPTRMFLNKGIMGPMFATALERAPVRGRTRHVALYATSTEARPLAETTRAEIPERIVALLDRLLAAR